MLIERVQKSIPDSLFVVPQTTPIPFFGNYEKAKACTISINPSYQEFVNSKGVIHKKERLTSRARLKREDDKKLSLEDAQAVIQSCDSYFENSVKRHLFLPFTDN